MTLLIQVKLFIADERDILLDLFFLINSYRKYAKTYTFWQVLTSGATNLITIIFSLFEKVNV